MNSIASMGISINGEHSYIDFGLYLSSRDIALPARKIVTATVPFMSGYYDFSDIYGEPAYDSRTLTYTFDLLADTPEAVEELKNRVFAWAKTAVESKIYDDDDPDYYFRGSFSTAEYTANEDLPECGGEIKLAFLAQPYRYSRTTDEGVI